VAHSHADLDAYRSQAREVAKFCERWGMHYQEILGSSAYFEHLIQIALLVEQADENFILVPPGGELRQDQFMRLPT
jgi:phosphatidate phosphatase APP1